MDLLAYLITARVLLYASHKEYKRRRRSDYNFIMAIQHSLMHILSKDYCC